MSEASSSIFESLEKGQRGLHSEVIVHSVKGEVCGEIYRQSWWELVVEMEVIM